MSENHASRAERILVFIPMYNCEHQIGRVLGQLRGDIAPWIEEVLILDNRSTDDSVAVAQRAISALSRPRVTLLRNAENYGLGGSHKVAFGYACQHDFDYCIVFHGDDQASIADLLPFLRDGRHRSTEALLGARFLPQSKLIGYSRLRTWGNHLFNALFSLAAGRHLHDLGSGLNMFSVRILRDGFYTGFADDLTFNYHLILAMVGKGISFEFFPMSWREEDQVSNVKMMRQTVQMLGILARWIAHGRQPSFCETAPGPRRGPQYTAAPAIDLAPHE